jgi:uncharacterized protein YciI
MHRRTFAASWVSLALPGGVVAQTDKAGQAGEAVHTTDSTTVTTTVTTTDTSTDTSTENWFIFLERGRPTPDDKPAVQAMQLGHINNFKRLFALGLLQGAGPLRDPSGHKRGIVTVRAVTKAEVAAMFQPDAYVRDGYMTLNAQPARVRKGLNTEGIDDTRVEELRIVQLLRGSAAPQAVSAAAQQAYLQRLLDRGVVGAWYSLPFGPVAEVLFANTKDTAALEAAFAGYPGLGSGGASVAVWSQWLSPGVVR